MTDRLSKQKFMQSTNTVWHNSIITRNRRQALNNHQSVVLWFTGLSGAGKSTLAHAVEARLYDRQCRTFTLDGDNVRHGLCGDLGFSEADRQENIRRVGETAKLFLEAGVITLTAFISPFRDDRARVRSILPHGQFLEIYCEASLAICEARDTKGLYAKARAGQIKNFTGIDSPYEPPQKPELTVKTGEHELIDCVDQVMQLLEQRGIINA